MILLKTWWGTKYYISLPWIDYGGVIADDSKTAEMLIDHANLTAHDEGVQFVELRSRRPYHSNLTISENKVTFLLDLNRDTDQIWKGFGAKLRNQIRKSEKSGLITEFHGIDKLPEFYKVFSWKMRDLGTPVWGYKFFERILINFADTTKIILVKKETDTIAVGLLLSFKGSLYVPSASSYNTALKYCPNHAL